MLEQIQQALHAPWYTDVTTLSAVVAAMCSVVGAYIGVRRYLKRKEGNNA